MIDSKISWTIVYNNIKKIERYFYGLIWEMLELSENDLRFA